jgi:hypothetical protein
MAAEKAFAAFISYSHATDNELGPLLQEGIEKFAKPWYRPRARRVFLDNSVLAAESDLTQAILAGLSNAEHFLLLASPASAQSPWVAKEVAWWLENRDRRTLFVLLTDGAAVWDNGVLDQERTTALHAVAARTAVRAGRITVKELWYRPSDANCCPTGASLTRGWLRDGTLKPDPAVQVS